MHVVSRKYFFQIFSSFEANVSELLKNLEEMLLIFNGGHQHGVKPGLNMRLKGLNAFKTVSFRLYVFKAYFRVWNICLKTCGRKDDVSNEAFSFQVIPIWHFYKALSAMITDVTQRMKVVLMASECVNLFV